MLPDYPESKARLRELLTQPLAMAQQAGIFSQMKTRRMFEGHRMGLIREDGSVDISDLQHLKSELQIDLKDIESITTADVSLLFDGLSPQTLLRWCPLAGHSPAMRDALGT